MKRIINELSIALVFILPACAHKPPPRSQATAALTGALQRQARATDAAQTASKAIGDGLNKSIAKGESAFEKLSRADAKEIIIRDWERANP